jgi:hypothetical protein
MKIMPKELYEIPWERYAEGTTIHYVRRRYLLRIILLIKFIQLGQEKKGCACISAA